MTLNFVTLFNINYLTRGLALYQSLKQHCVDFNLYVIAFDNETYQLLSNLNYPNLIPISLQDFEDPQLLSIKNTRSAGEYCWTCTPSTILYCLKKYDLQNCTYLDADMYFYSNPEILINEMNGKLVLITEHRYTPSYDQSEKCGKYCVQFITAFNNPEGLKVMEWWRNACIDWCYARAEDGKFGDQKYLDDWTTRFNSVHELQNLGGGIAPWNVQQYKFEKKGNQIIGTELKSNKNFTAVFFHFHGLKFYKDDMVSLTFDEYKINKNQMTIFYFPYVKTLLNIKNELILNGYTLNSTEFTVTSPYTEMSLAVLKQYYKKGIQKSKINYLGFNLIKNVKQHYYFKANKL